VQVATELHRDLVLVGGGHSHALALRMLAMQPIAGLRITLISPSSHTPYSGMLPGLIAGHYSFEQAHIDLARLCQWAGVRFIAAEVTGLDASQRRLSLADRPDIDYDMVSIDIGSQPELDSVPGARAHATPVKPIAGLWQRWQELHGRLTERNADEEFRISVVGGGAGSVELALAISHRLEGKHAGLDLWCAAPEVLQNYNARARQSAMRALKSSGITVHLAARVAAVERSSLVLADGSQAQYDELFWCTGAAAAPWVAASGLVTDERGFLEVRDTLQALQDDRVFGAGDIATQINHPRPKAGVYAVRQGPVLAHNLRAALLGVPLRRYRPQQRFLSLVSLGARQATADKGPFSATGRWVWRWKDRIDRAFMARFEDLPATMPVAAPGSLPELDSISQQPACGGCGAKVGADALTGALVQLSREFPQHCVGGGDDATALPAPTGVPILQSLDVLRQMVSDPWQMGRIAANHALSDLYACGAKPVSALAAVTLPYASGALLQRELQQYLAGALHEFAAVNCQLRGGHSMQGQELSLGFAVNGIPIAQDGTLLNKSGAAVGDQLVLTKPLGTGTLFAAHMQLAADGRDVSAAIVSMLQGNGAAAELALAHGASACTDITGFGLLGHLLEMLGGEHGARLQLESLPLLNGAIEQLQAGIVSTMHAANSRSSGEMMQPTGSLHVAHTQILFDPQTSGGLLIALPAARAASLCTALHQHGYASARVIGEVTPLTPGHTRPVDVS
jgi:selenide,water dikinase